MLLRNPGKLLSHRQLLHDVWGPGYDNAGGNLRLYMAQLRRKLEPDPARPRWLITEPGMGYRFQPPERRRLPGGVNSVAAQLRVAVNLMFTFCSTLSLNSEKCFPDGPFSCE